MAEKLYKQAISNIAPLLISKSSERQKDIFSFKAFANKSLSNICSVFRLDHFS